GVAPARGARPGARRVRGHRRRAGPALAARGAPPARAVRALARVRRAPAPGGLPVRQGGDGARRAGGAGARPARARPPGPLRHRRAGVRHVRRRERVPRRRGPAAVRVRALRRHARAPPRARLHGRPARGGARTGRVRGAARRVAHARPGRLTTAPTPAPTPREDPRDRLRSTEKHDRARRPPSCRPAAGGTAPQGRGAARARPGPEGREGPTGRGGGRRPDRRRAAGRGRAAARPALGRARIAVLQTVSPRRAARFALDLGCTPPDGAGRRRDDRAARGTLSTVTTGSGARVVVETWAPAAGDATHRDAPPSPDARTADGAPAGRDARSEAGVVYLAHGWGGWRGQLGAFVEP